MSDVNLPNISALRRRAPGFRRQISSTKIALDEFLGEVGKLLSYVSASTVASGMSMDESQRTFLGIKRAVADGIDLRGVLVDTHVSARNVAAKYMPEFATGDTSDTPIDPLLLADRAETGSAAAPERIGVDA